MADFVKFDVNQKDFDAFVARALEVTGDLKIPFAIISNDFYQSEKRIFGLKGTGGFADLSDNPTGKGYRSWKIKKFGNRQMLKVTGDLEKSITSPHAPGSVFFLSKKVLIMGTNWTNKRGAPYPKFLQEGTKKMPARRFVFIEGRGRSYPTGKEFQGRYERWTRTIGEYMQQVYKTRGWTTRS